MDTGRTFCAVWTCSLVLTVSNGWPATTWASPPRVPDARSLSTAAAGATVSPRWDTSADTVDVDCTGFFAGMVGNGVLREEKRKVARERDGYGCRVSETTARFHGGGFTHVKLFIR